MDTVAIWALKRDRHWTEWMERLFRENSLDVAIYTIDLAESPPARTSRHGCEFVIWGKALRSGVSTYAEWHTFFEETLFHSDRSSQAILIEKAPVNDVVKSAQMVIEPRTAVATAQRLLYDAGVRSSRAQVIRQETMDSFPPLNPSYALSVKELDAKLSEILMGERELELLVPWWRKSKQRDRHAFLVFDIDGLGNINKKFEREGKIGNMVIAQFRYLLNEHFSPTPVHRVGDDTFMALIAGSSAEALSKCSSLVVKVREYPWSERIIDGLIVTCSASFSPFSDDEPPQVTVLRAATGCRDARHPNGGNRVLRGPEHFPNEATLPSLSVTEVFRTIIS